MTPTSAKYLGVCVWCGVGVGVGVGVFAFVFECRWVCCYVCLHACVGVCVWVGVCVRVCVCVCVHGQHFHLCLIFEVRTHLYMGRLVHFILVKCDG